MRGMSRRGVCGRAQRTGSAMVAVAGFIVVLGSLLAASVTVGNSRVREQEGHREDLCSLYVAEAGLAEAVLELDMGLDGTIPATVYGGATYAVTATDLGGGQVSLVATGVDHGETTRIQMIVEPVSSPLFAFGAFGDQYLDLASNAMTDSYDSTGGAYAALNSSGSSAYANANGSVGSNGGISLSSHAMVNGDATPGPGHQVTLNGSNTTMNGAMTPASSLVSLPPIVLPVIPTAGDYTITNQTTVNLPSGSYHFDQMIVGKQAKLEIVGPATLVFESFYMNAGSAIEVDATNGPVEIYVVNDFVLNSNTRMASITESPADLSVKLLSDNIIDPNLMVDVDLVDLNSNASLFGTIYAPNALVEVNSNFELYGAIAAAQLELDSNSKVHFDEALLTSGPMTGVTTLQSTAWRILAD